MRNTIVFKQICKKVFFEKIRNFLIIANFPKNQTSLETIKFAKITYFLKKYLMLVFCILNDIERVHFLEKTTNDKFIDRFFEN